MIHGLIDFLRTLTTPDLLIHLLSSVITGWLGYALLVGIVFAETGLLVGFFLPGDSLLFTVGVVAGAGQINIALIIVLLICATMVGDWSGYLIGRRTGRSIFNRSDSRLFKREHLLRTQAFYEKHGGKTIIYAKFIPIVRTFAPFIAGVAEMRYSRFLAFDIFGGIGWVTSMTLAGYFLGAVPLIRANFEKVVILIVLVSVVPILIQALRSRGQNRVQPQAWRLTRVGCSSQLGDLLVQVAQRGFQRLAIALMFGGGQIVQHAFAGQLQAGPLALLGHFGRSPLRPARRRRATQPIRSALRPICSPSRVPSLHVQIPHVQRVLFDELAAALHVLAHQRGEDRFRFGQVLQIHFQQRARFGVHGGFPELLGVHFAQPFVALHVDFAGAFALDVFQQSTPVA